MEFTPSDILRLYGKQLFILPDLLQETEAEEHVVQHPAFLTAGSSINWKMKPGSKLALILRPDEFANRELTDLLRQVVLEAGIATGEIGFGVLEPESASWNFLDMPVPLGIVFEQSPSKGEEHNMFQFGGKRLYFAGKLQDLKSSDSNNLPELLQHILGD